MTITDFLSELQLGKLIAACSDPANIAARDLLEFARVTSATGLAVRMVVARDAERDAILQMARVAMGYEGHGRNC